MSRPGWIKIWNQTLDSDFWMIDQPFSYRDAFIHVLISANYKQGITDRNGHTLTIQRGQWLTSIRKLSATFRWDKHKVYQWLKFMNSCGMLTSQNVKFGTLLTVVNYGRYQDGADTVTHTPAHEDTHEPAHKDTHKVTPRSKTEEGRKQKEDVNPAHAGPAPVKRIGPPMGSPEWYAQHNDD